MALPRVLPVAGGAFAGGYQMGTVVWHGCCPGQTTIISGILNLGVDAFGDAAFNDISASVRFNSAIVSSELIPEPGTASLLGLGLVGLVLMRRRRS